MGTLYHSASVLSSGKGEKMVEVGGVEPPSEQIPHEALPVETPKHPRFHVPYYSISESVVNIFFGKNLNPCYQ